MTAKIIYHTADDRQADVMNIKDTYAVTFNLWLREYCKKHAIGTWDQFPKKKLLVNISRFNRGVSTKPDTRGMGFIYVLFTDDFDTPHFITLYSDQKLIGLLVNEDHYLQLIFKKD
jgi:hypothetical protein